ncbi:MAG: SHOCT domain-containing protein [Solirubrobacterales bacterium]
MSDDLTMDDSRPRSGWVKLTTFFVGLFTVLALITSWLDSQLLDTNQWVDTSGEMLQSPEIQSAVAAFAVEELYANVDVEAELKQILPKDLKGLSGIAAGGLRQVADQGAEQALTLPQVQTAWEQANRAAHTTFIDVVENKSQVLTTGGGQVELQLRPLIIAIADQIGLGSQARQNIPASVGSVQVIDSKQLETVQKVAGALQGFALIFSLLLVLLIALTVYLARGWRWLALIWAAGALILGSILILVFRAIAQGYVVDALATPDLYPAANSAYSIGTQLLTSYAWTTIWAAVFLLVLSWLVSPASSSVAARRYLAVPFGRFPGATFGLLGLVGLVFLLMGAGNQRVFLVHLLIVIVLGVAAYLFRRELIAEHPEADAPQLGHLVESGKEKLHNLWSRRPKEMPGTGFFEEREARKAEAAATAVTAEAAKPAAAADETARLEQLERLGKLHDTGVLSEEEFQEEKTRILGPED